MVPMRQTACGMRTSARRSSTWRPALFLAGAVLAGPPAVAQVPTTRAGVIEQARREKAARLWPERESPMVRAVNRRIEQGLGSGVETGKGISGLYGVLGGMRSGQGMSFGAGYGRTDVWHERLDLRTSARMTPQLAYMLDGKLEFNGLRSTRSFGDVYLKYEHSPHIDYYGQGPRSSVDAVSSYKLDDLALDANVGFTLARGLRLGLTGGGVSVRTGPGARTDNPATQDTFPIERLPGLEHDTDYARWGGFLSFDRLDDPDGPRSGFLGAVRLRTYADVSRHTYSFRQADIDVQQFIPYYNKSRVIALRLSSVMSYAYGTEGVPIYFQPTLGGNDDLRAFSRYRFTDNHRVFGTVEHRWYVMSALDMALFFDAGKVARSRSDLQFSDLQYGGGVGFRFKFKNATVMRIDLAKGSEGFRAMWTFSDAFLVRH